MINKTLMLNFKALKEYDISIMEFLFLSNLYLDRKLKLPKIDIDVNRLQEKQLIKIIDEKILLREKTIKLIEFSLTEIKNDFFDEKKIIKKSKRIIDSEINSRINEYRFKWKGLKPGSMGSFKSCKQKLTRWMKENPEYNFDNILKAAELYLATEGLNLRFLQNAEYFIFKQNQQKEESSRLSAFIDELQDSTIETSDWTSKIN